ncbi:MAG: EamA family transporter [Proteobacteria bacterium]|nr:EamA family transporter [Pseudomonadota bacterium]
MAGGGAIPGGVFFSMGIQFLYLGLRHGDSRTGTLIDTGATAGFYWLLSPFFLRRGYWAGSGFLIFVAVGLFRPVLSANLALAAVRRLGPTLTSTLTATTPLFAALFGVSLPSEELTRAIVLGTLAVVAGTAVQTMGGGMKDGATRPWPLWAPIFPLGAAGIVHSRAVWSMNAALAFAPASIVVPLVSTTPLFTQLLDLILFRRETVTLRRLAMVAMVVAGVILIAAGRQG